MDWATFKARQVHFAKGDEQPADAAQGAPAPDPDRAEATQAAVDALAWLG